MTVSQELVRQRSPSHDFAETAREMELSVNSKTLLPLSGIALVALVVATFVLGGSTPGTDEAAAEVASFYDENEVRQFITSFLFAATVPFLILFAVALRSAAEDPSSFWGQVAMAGAVLAGGVILMTTAIHFALLDVATRNELAREAVVALNFVDGSTWVAFNAGFGVMMLGAAGVILSGSSARRWLGWIALVLGIALFIPVADFFALLAMLVWVVVVSVLLARASNEAESVATHDAAWEL